MVRGDKSNEKAESQKQEVKHEQRERSTVSGKGRNVKRPLDWVRRRVLVIVSEGQREQKLKADNLRGFN